ncbi:MAG: hypothetical protein JO292_10240 [Betaproteobacteria bacterium]|nr:hypothetical protein [Betaproteobacteria bacterium]
MRYNYPLKSTSVSSVLVPMKCIAWVAIRQANGDAEALKDFSVALTTLVEHGEIDREVGIALESPAEVRSMELKSVHCSAAE